MINFIIYIEIYNYSYRLFSFLNLIFIVLNVNSFMIFILLSSISIILSSLVIKLILNLMSSFFIVCYVNLISRITYPLFSSEVIEFISFIICIALIPSP